MKSFPKLVSRGFPLRSGLLSLMITAWIIVLRQKWRGSCKNSQRIPRAASHTQQTVESKIRMNVVFFRRFLSLVKLCIPSLVSHESLRVTLLVALLLVRTNLTLIMAQAVGRISKALVERNASKIVHGISDIAMWALPATVTNVGISYTTADLQNRFRGNLQKALHAQYLYGYNVLTISSHLPIDNPDHRLTHDVQQFCEEFTDILPSIFKPMLDITIFLRAIFKKGGYGPPAMLVGYYAVVSMALQSLHPNFAYLVSKSQEREGDLRAMHAQLAFHAEEVAFYRGEDVERDNALRLLSRVIRHESLIKHLKWKMGVIDTLLIKHGATAIGYIVCAVVVFGKAGKSSVPELMELYSQSTQLYVPLSRAIGKILGLSKKMGALVGCTHRVGVLKEALDNLATVRNHHVARTSASGTVQVSSDGSTICMKNVFVTTPDGKEVIRNLTCTIHKGCHTQIMGGNGSGKSSLLRTIASLWPPKSGKIIRPSMTQLTFLPQRVYLPEGTLRDALTYPLSREELTNRGITDTVLLQHAAEVGVLYIIAREGGLDADKPWHEVLSGGERQRVALIRVLCQRPVFAFLDECTSAISQDIEPMLYTCLQRYGVTLVTVSCREALVGLHKSVLVLDGQGSYTFKMDCQQAY